MPGPARILSLAMLFATAAVPPSPASPDNGAPRFELGRVRLSGHWLFLNVKLWAPDHWARVVEIPSGHAGWAFASANGVRSTATDFRTPGYPQDGISPYRVGDARLHYAESVNIPVMIETTAAPKGSALVRLVFLTVANGEHWTAHTIVAPVTIG